MNNALISLLITTYNWKEALELVLLSVFRQTVKPYEILIADDGSRSDTKDLINGLRTKTDIPIVHIWHEDKGFRLSKIRNKAIVAAKGDYIIQIDGDCILEKHFIQDHIDVMKSGSFVCGSRVCCSVSLSKKWLSERFYKPHLFYGVDGRLFNSLRIGVLRKYLLTGYTSNQPMRLRGCNMGFWRSDLIKVNGYNEFYEKWGHEDADLGIKLMNMGLEKRTLKMGGVMYHLYHKQNVKPSSEEFLLREKMIYNLLSNKYIIRTEDGLDKYSVKLEDSPEGTIQNFV